jgi:hypothetical protein
MTMGPAPMDEDLVDVSTFRHFKLLSILNFHNQTNQLLRRFLPARSVM